ncbi:MAG: hypothetical protein ACUZ77_06175 [Candidatus Brocadiales bacterium]
MKSYSLIKKLGAFAALVAVVTLLGSSVYGEAPALQIPVINGTVTSINTEYDYILIQGSDILGNEPLYLQTETGVFECYEGIINFDELYRNAKTTSALDRVGLGELNVGDEVSCTYTYLKGGKLIADSVVITRPSMLVPGM